MTEAPAAVPVPLTGAPAPKKDTAKLTQYVVLKDIGELAWQEMSRETARSAKAAISAYVTTAKIDAGTFIAVPSRSFDPITVKTETSTKLTFAS